MTRHDSAELNRRRFHFATQGEGELILFAHGFPEFWYAWKDQLAEFGRTHLAVAPDLRGYNLTAKPKRVEDYEMKFLVEDMRALAAHFGFGPARKFILVGHDWGGVVAWAFALAYPESLARLVIINAPHPAVFQRELAENPQQQEASAYIQILRTPMAESAFSAGGYASLVQTVLAEGLRRGYFSEEDKKAYLEAWAQPGALTGGLNWYRAAQFTPGGDKAADPSNLLPGLSSWVIKVPTLVIWGMKDPYLLPGNLEGLDQFVPNLTVKRFPEASHWVVHEIPAEVNATIRSFLEQL
jgi:pimeloyl-ACP methyl ester carboxylesterase